MNDITNISQLTAEIVLLKNQTAQNIIEIGKRLVEVKEQLPHGEWGKWLEEKVDFTDRTAQRFIKIANEFPTSMSHLGTGKLFKLLDVPQDQREDFIQSNPIDEMTTRQLAQAIKDKKEVERQLEVERNKPPRIVERVVEKKPADYDEAKRKSEEAQKKFDADAKEIKRLQEYKVLLERKIKLTESEVKEYDDLKYQIKTLTQKRSDMLKSTETIVELSGLVVKIEHFLKNELAPIKYARSIQSLDNQIALDNLTQIINSVVAWTEEMSKLLPKGYVEVIEYESID